MLTYLADVVKWQSFGAYLLPKKYVGQLQIIAANNMTNIPGAKQELYNLYFRVGELSWTKVVDALEKAGEITAAKKIKEDL